MKNLFLISILFLIGATLLVSCEEKKKVVIQEVTVVTIKDGDVKEIWTIVGQTVSDPKVELLARVKGFLEKRTFKEGTFVKKGELLFQIEKDQYEALVKKAKADLAINEAVLTHAIITYKRNKLLREKDSVSQADLDKATATKDAAIGEVDGAKAELSDAMLDLSYTNILAPFNGRIGLAKYNEGNMIGPDSGVLATVVSLNPMCVEFSVNEADFLRAQQEAIAHKVPLSTLLNDLDIRLILSNGSKYEKVGKIYFWNNTISSSTGTILMRADFENPEYILNPGQYVNVKIQSSVPQKKLIMPQVAIQSALGGKFVMIVDKDNIVQTRSVKLGYRFDDMIVVKEGLKAGDKVIVEGIQKVRQKEKVIPLERKVKKSNHIKNNNIREASELKVSIPKNNKI